MHSSDEEPHEREARFASELADARLGVAEEFVWGAAAAPAILVGFAYHWLVGVVVFGVAYWLLLRSYRKAANNAEAACKVIWDAAQQRRSPSP